MLFVQIDVTLRHVLFSNSVIEICSFSFLGWVEGRSGDTNSFVVVFFPYCSDDRKSGNKHHTFTFC